MIVYLDTCVWVSLFKGEKGRWFDRDVISLNLFNRCLAREFKIVVSDWPVYELECALIEKELSVCKKLIEELKASGQTVEVKKEKKDILLAKKMSSHFQDPLHALLAKRARAEILLTWDRKGFLSCARLLQIKSAHDF